jgi:hypothetical protein
MFPDTKARIEHIWNVSRIQNLKSIAACLKLAVLSISSLEMQDVIHFFLTYFLEKLEVVN